MRYSVITMLAVAIAVPAAAQERTAYRTIIAGDYADAARTIEAQRKANPNQPELMLNLAAAYARMGRTGEASALYTSVLNERAGADGHALRRGSVVA